MKRTTCLLFALFVCLFLNRLLANDSELIRSVSVIKVENGKRIAIDSIEIQINNRNGDRDSEFELPYSRKEKLSIEQAFVCNKQGQIIRKLKNGDITTRHYFSEAAFFQDTYVKEFQLRHNTYPYTIFLVYKRIGSDFLSIAHWEACNRPNQSVRSAELHVEVPLDFPIRYQSENIAPPQIKTVNSKQVYSWYASYEKHEAETMSPRTACQIPSVNIIPLSFKYGLKGSWETWETFGEWQTRLNANAQELPTAEKLKLDRLLNGLTIHEKIKVLYRYLQQNTRYINVSIHIGGWKTYPAEYVSINKYGDCKALSNYMISLLAYAGIPAYYTLVYAGEEMLPIDISTPMPRFNHAIVCVPLDNDTIFLECTNKNIPCGYTGTFTQGRSALLISDSSHLVQIPELTAEYVRCTSQTTIALSTGYSKIHTKQILRGKQYEYWTAVSHHLNTADRERYSRQYFQNLYDMERFDIDLQAEKAEINLEAELAARNMFTVYDRDITIRPFSRALPPFEMPENRKLAIELNYPIAYTDTIIYTFPYEVKKISTLEEKQFESKYGSYRFHYQKTGEQLIVIKEVIIRKGKYEIDEYPDFYAFISEIKKNENTTLYFKEL